MVLLFAHKDPWSLVYRLKGKKQDIDRWCVLQTRLGRLGSTGDASLPSKCTRGQKRINSSSARNCARITRTCTLLNFIILTPCISRFTILAFGYIAAKLALYRIILNLKYFNNKIFVITDLILIPSVFVEVVWYFCSLLTKIRFSAVVHRVMRFHPAPSPPPPPTVGALFNLIIKCTDGASFVPFEKRHETRDCVRASVLQHASVVVAARRRLHHPFHPLAHGFIQFISKRARAPRKESNFIYNTYVLTWSYACGGGVCVYVYGGRRRGCDCIGVACTWKIYADFYCRHWIARSRAKRKTRICYSCLRLPAGR